MIHIDDCQTKHTSTLATEHGWCRECREWSDDTLIGESRCVFCAGMAWAWVRVETSDEDDRVELERAAQAELRRRDPEDPLRGFLEKKHRIKKGEKHHG